MDFPVSILGLPGALADASWNGVPFYMPDSRHSVGRRVQRFFFPGSDDTDFQDLGAFDGPMKITGLIVGDLYVSYGRQIEDALRTPGPGTLVHPWLGDLQMVLTEPAEITFSQKEQRVVRFSATFAPFVPPDQQDESTLDELLDAVAAVQTQVQSFLSAVLAPVSTLLWLAGSVESYANGLVGYWQAATGVLGSNGAAGNPQLAAAVAPAIAGLSGVVDVPSGAAYGAGVGALIAAVPAAVVAASQTLLTPAVGPGDAAVVPTPIDGRVTMGILLAASTSAQAQFTTLGLTASLALAESALSAIAAAQAATTIAWNSAQEAQSNLALLLAAIDATATQAAIASVPTVTTVAAAVQAGLLWCELQDARAALVADMTATIGRLPQVQTVVAASLPAWLIANILAGDTPGLIQSTYADLITRNTLRNPALVPAGPLETLASTASLVPA
jgi:prophage DNA circulation protein